MRNPINVNNIHILNLVCQVHGAGRHRLPRRNPSIRLHFHWNVSLVCAVLPRYVLGNLCSRWHVFCPCFSGTSSSRPSGPTKSTTCTVSWCLSWLSCASWPCVSPSCVRTSCSTLRTTDGECARVLQTISGFFPQPLRGVCLWSEWLVPVANNRVLTGAGNPWKHRCGVTVWSVWNCLKL